MKSTTFFFNALRFNMTLKDAKFCYHGGDCDADTEIIMQKPYIKEQLQKLSQGKLEDILNEYGCEYDKNDLHDMQRIVVWLAAGNIIQVWGNE